MAALKAFPNVRPALGFTAVCLMVGITYSMGSSMVIELTFELFMVIRAE